MPVDTTRVISTRRTQKQISEEEIRDIELKRLRGELSCAECRRLKLKCDKKVPCSSCVRRGCESICPCGILSAGQGTRFILADTDQLHRKISEMSTRIRQLEDALAILQASISDERHPLLSDDQLKIKFGGESLDHVKPTSTPPGQNTKEVIDAFGTLALGEDGNITYFGRSAGSETLMLAEDEECDEEGENHDDGLIALPQEVDDLSNTLPMLTLRRPNVRSLEILDAFLPDRAKALNLSNNYLNHAIFFFRPIKHEELFDSLLPHVYNTAEARLHARASGQSATEPAAIDDSALPHALASLFFVFSLGALLDINLPPYNAQAEHYYHLGRAALSLRKMWPPSLETIQAVGLMATYHSLAGKKYSRDSAWCIMSMAAKLAQSFGLHRDSARFSLDPATVQRRRNLFWEIFSADVSHSLALGRPPAIHLSYVDCEYPEDQEATLNDAGEIQSSFWKLKYDYAKLIFYHVVESTLAAQPPSYTTILDLDRKVREMSFPTSLKPYLSREDGDEMYYNTSLSVRDFYASQYRTVTMIYLHRSFFAQAMLDHPTNPLQSSFAPSFLTAYRSASIIIKATAHQFDRCEGLAKRIWFLLYHTFSAAVIAGTIVTRCPNLTMAPNALEDLNMAVLLFQKASGQSQRAKIALVVLKRLQDKALKIFNANSHGNPPEPHDMSDDSEDSSADIDLAIFGGQTRVLNKKSKPQQDTTASSPTTVGGNNEDRWARLSPTLSSRFPSSHDAYGTGFAQRRPSSCSPTAAADTLNSASSDPSTSSMPPPSSSAFNNHASVHSRSASTPRNDNTSYAEFLAVLSGAQGGLSSQSPSQQHRQPNDQGGLGGVGVGAGGAGTGGAGDTSSWPTWDSPIPTPSANQTESNASTSLPSSTPFEQWLTGPLPPGQPSSSSSSTDNGSMGHFAPFAAHHGSSSTASGSGVSVNESSSRTTMQPAYVGSDGAGGGGGNDISQFDLLENATMLSAFGFMSKNSLPSQSSPTFSANLSSSDDSGSGLGLGLGFKLHSVVGQNAVGISVAGGSGDALRVNTTMGSSTGGGGIPMSDGAIELGLSGESRLDSNWLAFMRDCGILGSGSSPPPAAGGSGQR